MDTIGIFALIVALAVLVKLIVILIKPIAWLDVIKPIYKNSALTTILSLILAAVVFYYLTLARITIVQIFAVMLFMALLIASGVAAYSDGLIKMAEKMLKDKAIIKKAWLPIVIWLVLSIWVLIELFA